MKDSDTDLINKVEDRLERTYKSIPWVDMTTDYCDVRLQVRDFKTMDFNIHCGHPSFDVDHRGHWGSTSLRDGQEDFRETARELVRQARNHKATSV